MTRRRLALGLALGLFGAVPVLADEPPSPMGVTAAGERGGQLDGDDDVDTFSVTLERGQDIILGTRAGAEVLYELVRPGGHVADSVKSFTLVHVAGFEYRARETGTHLVRVRSTPDTDAEESYPAEYGFWLRPDCRDGRTTRCGLNPGGSRAGRLDTSEDGDWFEVELRSGRRYLATVTATEGLNLEFLGATGGVLARRETDFGPTTSLELRPASTGVYYVKVGTPGYDVTVTYDLRLTPN